jgi:hypothetical protein
VLDLLRDGLSNERIAERLSITERTARYHVSEILSKLGLSSRQEAARWSEGGERRAWWALGPLALGWRKAAGVLVAAALVAGVAVGVALLVWGMTRTGGSGDAFLDGVTRQEARSQAATPEFLNEATRTEGDGWSIETRVRNLDELDLAVLVEELSWRVTLVDVHTGEAVAAGEFGRNVHVRLRAQPFQFLVADVSPEGTDRLLVFGVSGGALGLSYGLPLPQRPGYQGFANAMFLSPNEKELFVSLRSFREIPSCTGPDGYGATTCYEHAVGVVDLDARELDVIEHGPGCDFTSLVDTGTSSPVFKCGGGLDLVMEETIEGERWTGCERWAGPGESASWFRCPAGMFSIEGSEMHRLDVDEAIALGFVRDTTDGLRAIVSREVRIVDDKRETIAALADRPAWANGVFHLQNDVVLVGINPPPPSDTLFTEMLVLDLSDGHVFRRFDVDPHVWDVVVIDPSRLLLLVRDGERVELQQVDLRTGDLARTLEPQGLAGLPTALER